MARLIASAAVMILITGCAKGPTSSTSGPTPAGSAAAATSSKPPDQPLLRVKITGVYLGCPQSQDAARAALGKLGFTELTFDPKEKTVEIRAPEKELEKHLTSHASVMGTEGPRKVLNDAGLAVDDIVFIDYPKFKYFKVIGRSMYAIGQNEDKPILSDVVTLQRVFAGSPESQQAIRAALAPNQVTFMGDGPVKSIKVEGKQLEAEELIGQLKTAGFHAAVPDASKN